MSLEKRTDTACIICGERDYTWGHLSGYVGQPVRYFPRGYGLRQLPANLVGKGNRQVLVRECSNCRNLQLFSDSDHADAPEDI